MSNTIPETATKQALLALEDAKRDFIQDIVDKAREIGLERLISEARGTCTRRETTKALDSLAAVGAIRFELVAAYPTAPKRIGVYTTKPAPLAPVRRTPPQKKVEP